MSREIDFSHRSTPIFTDKYSEILGERRDVSEPMSASRCLRAKPHALRGAPLQSVPPKTYMFEYGTAVLFVKRYWEILGFRGCWF